MKPSLKQRVKEWDEYFTIHCNLPASAILDILAYVSELEEDLESFEAEHYDRQIGGA
jgi:hypothetical protein